MLINLVLILCRKPHFSCVTPVNNQREASLFPIQVSVPLISFPFEHLPFQSCALLNSNIENGIRRHLSLIIRTNSQL
jgi:hypothetical protein